MKLQVESNQEYQLQADHFAGARKMMVDERIQTETAPIPTSRDEAVKPRLLTLAGI
jgi:hypothetical protein